MNYAHFWLALCETFILWDSIRAGFPNLALHQPTIQSSIFEQKKGWSKNAVDGNKDNDFFAGHCSHTVNDPKEFPWWVVDLGQSYIISSLKLTNRGDCCSARLQNIEISMVEDIASVSSQVCADNLFLLEPITYEIECRKPVPGRYVVIRLLSLRALTLCEVEVYSDHVPKLYPGSFLVLHNSVYQETKMDNGGDPFDGTVSVWFNPDKPALIFKPKDLYANFAVRLGALVVGDTVLAQLSEDISIVKPLFEDGTIIGRDGLFRYKVQSSSKPQFVKYVTHSKLRHKDVCKLKTNCPPNSECSKLFLSDKFLPTMYMCRCKKGFRSSARRFAGFVLPETTERCLGGSIALNKPTLQLDTMGDAVSARAVDGNTDFRFVTGSSCSSTAEHFNAWWRVDLEKIEPVSEVFIQFRKECCDNEATQFVITVGPFKKDVSAIPFGDKNVNEVCSNFTVRNISEDKSWHVHCGRTMLGRYVYIRSLEKKNLTLCEVHVYREPTDNIALYMSNYTAASDGNVLTCFYGHLTYEPWWILDLQYVRPVALVLIRTGVVYSSPVVVIIGMQSSDQAPTCISSNAILKKDEFVKFSCNRPNRWSGRYVIITIPNVEEHLSLCEVNVYAVFEYNLLQGKQASQSSVPVEDIEPQEAIDGDRETCTLTKIEKDPWWKVSIGSKQNIGEVLIYTKDTLLSLTVFVGEKQCGQSSHAFGGIPTAFNCTPKIRGREVTITTKGEDRILSLCEVEVYTDVQDDDECQAENTCPEGRVCKNLVGSYKCGCSPGLRATPGTENYHKPVCQDIDECLEDPCGAQASCLNSFGSFSCLCNAGFKKNGSRCLDVDECAVPDLCDRQAECVNSLGSYMCICLSGYSGDASNLTCHDLDECAAPDTNTCHKNAKCINTFSSFSCKCKEGWFGDGKFCLDINECQFHKVCPEHSDCKNKPGTFECLCHRGFRKSSKGSCIFEIPDPNTPLAERCGLGKKECTPHIKCILLKAFYRCTCEENNNGNEQKCVDTDACSRGLVPSNDRAKCINVLQSYDCVCGKGYSTYRPSCADLEGCVPGEKSIRCRPFASCVKIPDSSLCYCNEGFLRDGLLCDVC